MPGASDGILDRVTAANYYRPVLPESAPREAGGGPEVVPVGIDEVSPARCVFAGARVSVIVGRVVI